MWEPWQFCTRMLQAGTQEVPAQALAAFSRGPLILESTE